MAITRKPRGLAQGLVLLMLLQSASAASGEAVEALNGSAAVDWSYGDGPYTTTQSYALSAALNVPLWSYLGASAFLSTDRTRTKGDLSALLLGGSFTSSSDDNAVGGSLFVRAQELGRLAFDYREALQAQRFAYAGELQVYLSRWTVSAGIQRDGVRNARTFSGSSVRVADTAYLFGANFYPTDGVRLDVRAIIPEAKAYAGSTYSAGVEWLPASLRLQASARFSYARVTGDATFLTNNRYGVSLSYFFAPTAFLFTLDRAYR